MSDITGVLDSALGTTRYPMGEIRQYKRGGPRPETPHADRVPRDKVKQLVFREALSRVCLDSKEVREATMQACEEDVIFFLNVACWLFEPRTASRLPFCTWKDQEWILVWWEECFGERDSGCEKTRGLGLSWDIVAFCYWKWLFEENCHIGLVSRNEKTVDTMDDPDSLMWKLDFIHKHCPKWMIDPDVLNRTYSDHRFHRADRGNTIIGYEATGNVMTGGRKRAIFLDEFGKFEAGQQQLALDSTQHVSNSRYFVSTFKRAFTRFYQMMRTEESSMLKIVADWRDNEERSKGLYTVRRGEPFIIDTEYKYPENYEYVTGGPFFFGDGEERSPWFDAECDRPGATPEAIAEELCRVPVAPGSKLFSSDVLARVEAETCCEPLAVGELDYSRRTWDTVWIPSKLGKLKLWTPVDSRGNLERGGPYAVGCDIAAGSGSSLASFSVAQIVDVSTGHQVAEYCSNEVDPVQFTQIVYALCRWFSQDKGSQWVVLNWESNGIGGVFTKEIKRLGWGNNYVQENLTHRFRKKKTSRIGWHNQDGGESVLLEMQRAMATKEITIKSAGVVADCRPYERDEKGKVIHGGIELGTGRSHGDRACALGICWLAAKDRAVRPSKYRVDDRPDERWKQRDAPTRLMGVRDNGWWSELEPMELA